MRRGVARGRADSGGGGGGSEVRDSSANCKTRARGEGWVRECESFVR